MFGKIIEKFSSNTNEEVKAYELRVTGIILLVWGCLLYLVDATIIGKVFYLLPGLKELFSQGGIGEGKGTLNLSIDGQTAGKIPMVLSIIIIFIGIVLILHSHKGLKSQVNIVVCPLFYTLAFLFLIAGIQNLDNKTKSGVSFLFCGIFLLIGSLIHAYHKDKFPELKGEDTKAAKAPVVDTPEAAVATA
jgi:hypothetical protein